MAMTPLTTATKTQLYQFFAIAFNAAPGVTYMNQLYDAYNSGMSVKDIVNVFTTKSQFTNIYPNFLDSATFADRLIENVVGSSATAAAKTEAKADVVAALGVGMSRGDVIYNVFNNLSKLTGDAKWGGTATQMTNKVAYAQYYTETLLKGAETSPDMTALQAVISGVTDKSSTATADIQAVLNPAPAPVNQTFTLTAGVDNFTGGAGADTFVGNSSAAALTLTSLDNIDGGAGNDSLSISVTAAVDTTTIVGATVKNIESVAITSTGAITANTTAWTGVTNLAAASTGNSTLTASTTTDIAATVASPTGAGAAVVNGGKAVTLTLTDTATTGAASANTTTVGVTTQSTGAVTVSQTETITDAADAGIATGTIRVDGGTAVTISSAASVGAGSAAADVATIGAITVNGKGTVTSVSVTQSAATAAYAAAGDKIKVTNGGVTITDNNTATKADTITSVTLNNFGASTIQGNALTTLNLTGGSSAALASGTVGISQSAGLTTGAPTTLAINMTSGSVGVITDTNDQYTTLNIASAAASTIAGLDFTNVTTLAVSGAGVTTISAQTDLAKVTSITSTGGGLALTGTLGTAVAFTGGAGKETIDVGATTKAITTGDGDDNITVSATALGTGGSIDAGNGSDTLTMTAANAVTASASNTFATKLSNFEKLAIGNVAATGTVNANLLNLNTDVTVAGVAAGQVLTVAGLVSGSKVTFANATQTATTASLLNDGTADSLTVALSASNAATTVGTLTATGFETLNFSTANSATTPTAQAHVITTLTDATAKTITVTGNAGLTLGTFSGTALTSFDASGVTLGAVSYTTGVLTSGATLSGGAGADTLNAAASTATAGVTINGNAGNDAITGSATKASVLNGGDGNDTITGGAAADTIDGGTGNNTYVFSSANVVEQAGSSTTTGVVVNLGSTALTQSAVFTATGAYLTTAAPTVASGTSTYLFNGESSTNVSVVDTLANIQNVTGSDLADYIVGSDAANVITGGAGVDVIDGGAGADTIVLFTGAANNDTITFVATDDKLGLAAIAGDMVVGTALTIQTVATKASAANRVIVDTIANLGAAGVTIGDQSAYANDIHYAIASDTGAVFYDADGNWTAGVIAVGTITPAAAAALTVANFIVV